MSWLIEALPNFTRELKHLKKKYPSILQDVARLAASLREQPLQGTALGGSCYKIRLAIASKKQGKSGGARVITCVAVVQERITLLSIYDKSEQDTISDEWLQELRKLAED